MVFNSVRIAVNGYIHTILDLMPNNTNFSSDGCAQDLSHKDFDQISWTIAVSLAILAAICNNLGVNFQKLAWVKKQNNGNQKSYRAIWVLGLMGIILASVFDFVALAFGPQSVIAPLGALTIVLNLFVSPWLHGEVITKKIVIATLVIIAGAALAVATASHVNVVCGLNGVFAYFMSPMFAGFVLVVLAMIVSVVLFARKAEAILLEFKETSAEYAAVFRYHRVAYSFLAGLFGASSVVIARALGLLIMSNTRGSQLFLLRAESYALLVALIVIIFLQMYYLNKALEKFESMYCVPVFTGTFITGVAVSGGVVYQEFKDFTLLQAVLFPIGVSVCVLGVFSLAWGEDPEKSDLVDAELPKQLRSSLVIINEPVFETADRGGGGGSFTESRPNRLMLRSGGWTPFIVETGHVPKVRTKSVVMNVPGSRSSLMHTLTLDLSHLHSENTGGSQMGGARGISPKGSGLQHSGFIAGSIDTIVSSLTPGLSPSRASALGTSRKMERERNSDLTSNSSSKSKGTIDPEISRPITPSSLSSKPTGFD